MKENIFPQRWSEAKGAKLIARYEEQSEDEAVDEETADT